MNSFKRFLRGNVFFYWAYRCLVKSRFSIALYCAFYDLFFSHTKLTWGGRANKYWKKSAVLIFYYHKIEKALSMPARKNTFSLEAAEKTLTLLESWDEMGFSCSDPVFCAALESLRSYRRAVIFCQSDVRQESVRVRIDNVLSRSQEDQVYSTPIKNPKLLDQGSYDYIERFVKARRSVRNFKKKIVDTRLVEQAVALAQLSPSACNRQPCKVHLYKKPDVIKSLLAMQGGNKGFDHTIHNLIIVTADRNCFFDATERYEPSLDSGLFLMTFIYALHAQGISSCCLNWCAMPHKDLRARGVADIPSNEQIITFLAIGEAEDDAVVPLSARRSIESIVRIH